ncbi:ribokinase [Roseomonas frigidaquae]|uniref:Ribokinase n=1 Tax=Falsiroseomonas frigidaquae TaxID=487318 RepID=A0ABX1F7N3_9PROT|nr:ribokinase [Falsiroseomonas frigidaquae]NKE48357.1 ribokinase [Falsiroseomonas frigidaquae]
MSILVFGSANTDLVFSVPSLPTPGETVLGDGFQQLSGGKGANQAVAAARDGAQVAFAGCVGGDGLALVATGAMRDAGVDLSRLIVVDAPTGCASICVDREGRNQIAVAPGANLMARAAQVEDAALHPGVILLLQMEVPAGEVAALVLRAASLGAQCILNLAPPGDLPLEVLRALHLLVLNEHEAAVLAARLGTEDSAAALHLALGVAVAVTRGEAGAEAATAAGLASIPCFPVVPVDTTGAGDTWCGVLAAGLDRGLPLIQAMRRAAAAAALACTRPGAAPAMPVAAETDAMLATR